jgi:hypothetical protein
MVREVSQELPGSVLLRISQNLLRRTGFDGGAAVEEAHDVGHLAGEGHFAGAGCAESLGRIVAG